MKKNSGCLYYLFIYPFVLIFQLLGLMIKGLAWLWKKANSTPQSRKATLIIVGALVTICMCLGLMDTVGIIDLSTPTPTFDLTAAQQTAEAEAWLSYTHTALAMPTATETPTQIPTATNTPTPSETPLPTATIYIAPIQPTPSNCIAAYPDFCIQPGPRKSCDALGRYNFTVLSPDPLGYDGDKDGKGCER